MPANVLHIKPSAEFAHEAIELLASRLATVTHRSVTDASALNDALTEQPWDAILCDQSDRNSFLDSLPGMACQIRLDEQGQLHFPYVSEGCFDLLGLTPPEIEFNPKIWISYLHPDDSALFHKSMQLSANNAMPWNWEGRIILPPQGEIKWVNLRAKYRKTDDMGTHWKGFMVNITQNKQAGIELKHSRQRLRELSSHIENIKEEERTRIAREIHDEIGVLLTALKMDLAWLTQRLPAGELALKEKSQGMARLLDTAGVAANNLVHSLRPGSLDCFGIVAAIEIEATEFTKRTGIPCKVVKSSDNIDISDEQSITLFRVFQETLNNIMKHASARRVQVQIIKSEIDTNNKYVELIVSDDGCGFDETARNKPRSFGLRGIKERIRQLGGKLSITSRPGKGTKIAVRLLIKHQTTESPQFNPG